uniref:peptidylamidoglycolate lyase n=1 Tax=Anopheles atroparvus TaxID=41427 RepID=A0AAG5DBW9_ANOAO
MLPKRSLKYTGQYLLLFWIYFTHSIEARPDRETPEPVKRASYNGSSFSSRLEAYEYAYVSSWPVLDRKLGSVSAVDFDCTGNVVIFHRALHVWSLSSFDTENRFQNVKDGPIAHHTVLKFNRDTGQIIQEWGENLFYMPHGLTIDHEDNYWLTDVALHQVFKFDLKHSATEPMLALGQRFEPGNDMDHFCKPTSVAVLKNGDFFVADGYCNGRIVKYSPDGQPLLTWGRNSFILTRNFNLPPGPVPESFFAIPHALTMVPNRGLLCVADREQGRVQCFHTANGTFHSQYASPDIGSRLFSVKYVPTDGGLLYIINGPQFVINVKPVQGFIVEMNTGSVVGRFQPNNLHHAFENPHELAVTNDGLEVYVAELKPQMVHKFRRITGGSNMTLSTDAAREGGFLTGDHSAYSERSKYDQSKFGMSNSVLTAGSIGIFSIVSTLLVTSLLVILMARVICFRPANSGSRMDEVPLRNMGDA